MSQLIAKRLVFSLFLCGLLCFGWLTSESSEADASVVHELRSNTSLSPRVDVRQLDPLRPGHQSNLSGIEEEERDVAIVWDGVARSGGDFGNV